MKRPNLLVIISLISFLSIILITGSPFKSSTNSFDNNTPIFLEIPPIQAQNDGDDFEDDGGRNNLAGLEGEMIMIMAKKMRKTQDNLTLYQKTLKIKRLMR